MPDTIDTKDKKMNKIFKALSSSHGVSILMGIYPK